MSAIIFINGRATMPRKLANLDLDLVRTFVTIASLGGFTRAAARLGRQQSTISLQVQRLEVMLGLKLLTRTPRTLALTPDGERFLQSARQLLDLNDEIIASAQEPDMRGVVRLGAPEDFATRHLPDVLSRFAQAYPAVSLEVTCDLTLNLLKRFRSGDFDLALIKRERSLDVSGVRVWREPLVWMAGDRDFWSVSAPLPLVVSPAPCVYRQRAIEALDRLKRPWRVAYTCGSLAGSLAAVRAGLGVTVLPKGMAPPDLRVIEGKWLPNLKDTEIALLQADTLSHAAGRLKEHVIRSLS
jgi:DNA-binding transcriptional LysR family regulator